MLDALWENAGQTVVLDKVQHRMIPYHEQFEAEISHYRRRKMNVLYKLSVLVCRQTSCNKAYDLLLYSYLHVGTT